MKLTKTPSSHRVHDYSLALTKEELLALSNGAEIHQQFALVKKLFDLIDKEAKRLGSGE